MSSRARIWPALIIGSTVLVAVAYAVDLDFAPLRIPLTLWFLLVCPGMAWVRLLPTRDLATGLSIAIATSLALEIVTAGAFLYAHAWSTAAILAVISAISLAGAALQLVRPQRVEPAGAEAR